MWEIIAGIALPIFKLIMDKMAGKKLNDKEFADFVLKHQQKRSQAGRAAKDWKSKLKQARQEYENNKKSK